MTGRVVCDVLLTVGAVIVAVVVVPIAVLTLFARSAG